MDPQAAPYLRVIARTRTVTMPWRENEAMLIDKWMPSYDVGEHHEREIAAPPTTAYDAIKRMDVSKSLPVRLLLLVRGIPHFLTGRAFPQSSITLETFRELGFVMLEEKPGEELVLGAVGRFWMPASGIEPIAADDFLGFDEPGFAKATMNMRVEPLNGNRSMVLTETRVATTDEVARRRFKRYWRLIGPFSGFIRHQMLALVEKEVTPAA